MTKELLPGLPSLTLERDVACRMPDGVSLLADIYRPAGDSDHPVLLISHPYDKASSESNVGFAHPSWYARQGFMVVAQDSRGRHASEGTFAPFVNEEADVTHSIGWTRTLPGADGRVATYGFSYPGLNQLLAAQRSPEGLIAVAPALTGGSPYSEWFYTQGALDLAFAASWANFLGLDSAKRRRDELALAALGGALAGVAGWLWSLPLRDYAPLASQDTQYFAEWLSHPTLDDYWRAIEVDHTRVTVPALHVGGWYDVFIRGTVRNFVELTRAGHAPQKLVIGPWHHMPWRPLRGATDDVGPTVADDWHLRFWRHLLFGEKTGIFDSPATIYVLHEGWRDLDGWPPSSAEPVSWHLRSGGRAMSVHGDGVLTNEAPGNEPPDVFAYDPALPAMSQGGHSCCVEELVPMGPADQHPTERTKFVLVYTSEPLNEDLVLIGDALVTLYAASTATDTDFTARFCLVDEARVSTNIVEGIVRARSRESLSDPTPIEPGRVYEYTIELGPLGVRVAAGQRLRVTVSSSDFPIWDRNLNTGGPLFSEGASAAVTAIQTVLHDAEHPSRITLPVVR